MSRPTRQHCPHPEKTAHWSMSAAFRHLQSLERDGKGDGHTWPYPCPCGAIHLGHRKDVNKKTRDAYQDFLADHPDRDRDYTTNDAAIKRRIKKALKRR